MTAALAVAGFVIQGLAEEVSALRVARDLMPWHWLIDGDPLRTGFGFEAFILPLVVATALFVLGGWSFQRRDLH